MSLACCTSRTKEWERTETSDLEDSNLPITGQQQKTHLLKAILWKAFYHPQLAKELAEVIKTGKEEDQFYGLSSKLRG